MDDTVIYLSGASGRIVCTRTAQCAGVTLLSAFNRHPNARAWNGLNGEPYERTVPGDVIEIRALTRGAVCDCES